MAECKLSMRMPATDLEASVQFCLLPKAKLERVASMLVCAAMPLLWIMQEQVNGRLCVEPVGAGQDR